MRRTGNARVSRAASDEHGSPRAAERPILPGATIGVLGSGQLGRMFAIAARRMGYRVHTLSPLEGTPTGQVADVEYSVPYEDLSTVRRFAKGVSVATFEFENVPAEAVEAVAEHVPVRPAWTVLHTTQNRAREKRHLERTGLPLGPFVVVKSAAELGAALAQIGTPAILKTARFGYDGKGQARIDRPEHAEAAWASLGGQESVLEAFIDFEREVSVIAARGLDAAFAHYGVVDNAHVNHILDVTMAPAEVPLAIATEAEHIARAIVESLDLVGVLCVEMFLTKGGQLLVNELAPRPHNSGHFTFDACVTSQFEQQLRAVCGLPLGSTHQLAPAAMANLLGDLWERGEPNWAAAAAFPNVKIHLYGKGQARPGRKMGHLTALADTPQEAAQRVRAARDALSPFS
ncbi:MAG: 5-(carboxyamino)imidazole ribonucleotide synthase [Luteitalea sp.]|nr:5-(carboxyamino)imidazole ribonucleotide synthase [Luteitalea sp.]